MYFVILQALEKLGTHLREESELELQRQLAEAAAEAQSRLDQALASAEEEHSSVVKEVTDRLTREHRMELEGLRSRFRMVHASQMERSPSDTSLEKIEVSVYLLLFSSLHELIYC